jgi:PTH1 family peptidyl-tRNA hydrolase
MVDYVLSRPSRYDEQAILKALEAAAEVLPELLTGEFQKAMHRLHSPTPI